MLSVNGLLIWPMFEGRNFIPFEHVFVPFEQIFLPFEHLLSVMFICFMLVVARLHGKENPFSVDSVIESVFTVYLRVYMSLNMYLCHLIYGYYGRDFT